MADKKVILHDAAGNHLNPATIAEQVSNMADYIVEQGTSGDWTYRKWSSGFAECWGKVAKTATNYQTVNSFYAYNLLVTFPTGLFNAAPFVIFSAHAQSSAHTIADTQLNGTSTQINLYALLNVSGSQTIDLLVHAYGKWQ